MMIDELTRRVTGQKIAVGVLNHSITDVKKIRGSDDLKMTIQSDCFTMEEVAGALMHGEPWKNIVFLVRVSVADYEAALEASKAEAAQPNRRKELAKHLREQAALFRDEDPQGRGAAELEEAAALLEA